MGQSKEWHWFMVHKWADQGLDCDVLIGQKCFWMWLFLIIDTIRKPASNQNQLNHLLISVQTADASGHIFNDFRGILGCFGLFKIVHPGCLQIFGWNWLLPCSDQGDSLLGASALLHPPNSCNDGFSNGLQDLIMPPLVPPLSKFVQQLRMCSRVPRLEDSGHAGDSTLPHMYIFDGLASSSYTSWMKNVMQCGPLHSISAEIVSLHMASENYPACAILNIFNVMCNTF